MSNADLLNADLRAASLMGAQLDGVDLSIEAGELTPTMKTKRRVVNEHFAEQIESLYTGA